MKKVFILVWVFVFLALSTNLFSETKSKKGQNTELRKAKSVFDNQQNTVSNFQFYTTNYGKFGQDVANQVGGGVWPRGSQNQYVFGAGFWFGAQKYLIPGDTSSINKFVELSYNPNSGMSWFVPGRIEDGDTLFDVYKDKYRSYYSTDFNKDGTPIDPADGPNWSLWITGKTIKDRLDAFPGTFVYDENTRNLNSYPDGPSFVSQEDITSTYKDTDLDFFEGGSALRKNLGYPLRLQCEERIYSWDYIILRDIVIQSYTVQNKSNDTLLNCWFAPVIDFDIGRKPSPNASNDRTRYYNEDTSLNLAIGWSDANTASSGEKGYGFGYIGFSLLETPAIGENGFIRHDKKIFFPEEEIGLKTFKNWNIAEDINEDIQRYNAISSMRLDSDNGMGDKRIILATGPFNMLPGDVARVAIIYAFAMPAKGGEADGTTEDLTGFKLTASKHGNTPQQVNDSSLVGKIIKAKEMYYQSILGIKENNNTSGFSINAVYPNPSSQSAVIDYSLPSSGNVRLSLYNQLGQEVALLKNEWQNKGDYDFRFTLNDFRLNSGLYFIRLQAGGEVRTEKLVILK